MRSRRRDPLAGQGARATDHEVDDTRAKLALLKPAERRTLSLIAAGYSYSEVGEITGFSYTKINRCAAEGRARVRELAMS